mgnify:CR=1 FL=1
MTAQIIMPAAVQRRRKVRQRWGFYAIAALAALVCLTALFSEWIAPYDPNAQIFASLSSPSWEHWAGTDRYGRDLFSRILVGLRTSIFATLSLVFIIMTTGTIVGMICGYRGGYVDTIMMRISDVCLAFPGLVFALAIAALLNGGLVNAVFALAAISWPKYARIARSQTLRLKDSDFLAAAKMSGATTAAQIWRHILPNTWSVLLPALTIGFNNAVLAEASMSYLCIGVTPPDASLGYMLSESQGMFMSAPWYALGTGLTLVWMVFGVGLIGEGLQRRGGGEV